MITYSKNGTSTLLDTEDYYVQTEWDGWDNSLNFTVPIRHPQAADLRERLRLVVTDDIEGRTGQIYTISSYNKSTKNLTIAAKLDLDDLRGGMALNWTNSTATLAATIRAVLPSGWSLVDNTGRTDTLLVEDFNGTPLELIQHCIERWTYVAAQFDNVAKTITLSPTQTGTAKGTYFTTDLNLTETPSIKGKAESGTYYNRLYLFGKDGLELPSPGYVENLDYDSHIVSAYAQESSIETQSELLTTAQAMVDEASVPDRSYTCKLLDLAKIAPEKYSFLSYSLYDTVVLLDPDTQSRSYQRIKRTSIYPHYPEKDSVVLSTVPGTISRTILMAQSRADAAKRQAAVAKTLSATAKDLADTANSTADAATETANSASDTANTANNTAKQAIETANSVSTKLDTNYSTTTEVKNLIDEEKGEILLSVSKTYVSNTGLANTLGNYYTKSETNSAIEQKADSINLSVSQNYVSNTGLTSALSSYYTKSEIDVKTNSITLSVSTAQSTANSASSAASTAQTAANNAVSAASTAQSTANSAASAAATAQSTANSKVSQGNVRSSFASESSSISITSGTITFETGTIVINAANFKVDASGNLQISGSIYNDGGGGYLIARDTYGTNTASWSLRSGTFVVQNNMRICGKTSGDGLPSLEYQVHMYKDGKWYKAYTGDGAVASSYQYINGVLCTYTQPSA